MLNPGEVKVHRWPAYATRPVAVVLSKGLRGIFGGALGLYYHEH